MKFTSLIDLPRLLGMQHQVTVHDYFPVGYQAPASDSIEWFMQDRAYIQASLHADELPGILLNHHLIKMLDKASELGAIEKPITLVPFANPIGLNQVLLGSHIGRFSLSTGVNFNREWVDVTSSVAQKIENNLTDDAEFNVALIRKALVEETNLLTDSKIENVLKRELFKKAIISSVVLDLHCDTDAVMHMYTHDRLWPQMADLASFIDSKCTIIAPESGGNPFDEACSCVWATLADKFSSYPIPMACQSVTVELRGENQVYDELAIKDAEAIFNFLTKRGFIKNLDNKAFDLLSPEKLYVSPLTGVDMINAEASGVVAWKVKVGDVVEAGQVLGEIVNIEDVYAPRIPLISKTSGLVFGMRNHKLAVPGFTLIKVAGTKPLDWRKGKLLTAK